MFAQSPEPGVYDKNARRTIYNIITHELSKFLDEGLLLPVLLRPNYKAGLSQRIGLRIWNVKIADFRLS